MLGHSLGALHAFSDLNLHHPMRPAAFAFHPFGWVRDQALALGLPETSPALAILEQTFDRLSECEARLETVGAEKIGYCHGDARLGNVTFDGQRCHFFDFEHCGIGSTLSDLAVPIWFSFGRNPESASHEQAAHFLKGYKAANPVFGDDDWATMPDRISLRQGWCLSFLLKYRLLTLDVLQSFIKSSGQAVAYWTSDAFKTRWDGVYR